jgi:hypothetical protein
VAREYLPGQPSQKRIREVRSVLKSWGVRPLKHTWRGCDLWAATWEWADHVARSYYRPIWPSPREIASQYLFLLLMHVREDLRLPFRAGSFLPAGVKALLRHCGTKADMFGHLSIEIKEIQCLT